MSSRQPRSSIASTIDLRKLKTTLDNAESRDGVIFDDLHDLIKFAHNEHGLGRVELMDPTTSTEQFLANITGRVQQHHSGATTATREEQYVITPPEAESAMKQLLLPSSIKGYSPSKPKNSMPKHLPKKIVTFIHLRVDRSDISFTLVTNHEALSTTLLTGYHFPQEVNDDQIFLAIRDFHSTDDTVEVSCLKKKVNEREDPPAKSNAEVGKSPPVSSIQFGTDGTWCTALSPRVSPAPQAPQDAPKRANNEDHLQTPPPDLSLSTRPTNFMSAAQDESTPESDTTRPLIPPNPPPVGISSVISTSNASSGGGSVPDIQDPPGEANNNASASGIDTPTKSTNFMSAVQNISTPGSDSIPNHPPPIDLTSVISTPESDTTRPLIPPNPPPVGISSVISTSNASSGGGSVPDIQDPPGEANDNASASGIDTPSNNSIPPHPTPIDLLLPPRVSTSNASSGGGSLDIQIRKQLEQMNDEEKKNLLFLISRAKKGAAGASPNCAANDSSSSESFATRGDSSSDSSTKNNDDSVWDDSLRDAVSLDLAAWPFNLQEDIFLEPISLSKEFTYTHIDRRPQRGQRGCVSSDETTPASRTDDSRSLDDEITPPASRPDDTINDVPSSTENCSTEGILDDERTPVSRPDDTIIDSPSSTENSSNDTEGLEETTPAGKTVINLVDDSPETIESAPALEDTQTISIRVLEEDGEYESQVNLRGEVYERLLVDVKRRDLTIEFDLTRNKKLIDLLEEGAELICSGRPVIVYYNGLYYYIGEDEFGKPVHTSLYTKVNEEIRLSLRRAHDSDETDRYVPLLIHADRSPPSLNSHTEILSAIDRLNGRILEVPDFIEMMAKVKVIKGALATAEMCIGIKVAFWFRTENGGELHVGRISAVTGRRLTAYTFTVEFDDGEIRSGYNLSQILRGFLLFLKYENDVGDGPLAMNIIDGHNPSSP